MSHEPWDDERLTTLLTEYLGEGWLARAADPATYAQLRELHLKLSG